jgi:hypothetical protein
MWIERHIVDNRVFLLGLDNLYRESMKQHERVELLRCARHVAVVLHSSPSDVPVEGYYAEDVRLSEYFRFVRALQDFDGDAGSSVVSLPEFRRLLDVTSSLIYGRPQYNGKLLPMGRDALSQALMETRPAWTLDNLVAAAHRSAMEFDDISLVGLAARVQDAVVLTAARESVVLYAQPMIRMAMNPPPPQYIWQVDEDLVLSARRFINTFNELFGETLPAPEPVQAEQYWRAYDNIQIAGRCVNLGFDDSSLPGRHYHWAICRTSNNAMTVKEFWENEVWTTARYRERLAGNGRCPDS